MQQVAAIFITEFMHEVQNIINGCDTSKYIEETKKHLINWQNCHFDWATDYVYGVEKDYRLVKVGKVGCYLHGDGLANVILSDGLANFSNNKEYKANCASKETNGQRIINNLISVKQSALFCVIFSPNNS